MLSPVYNINEKYCPVCSNIRFSFVKAENVVNPPQIPTIRNSRHSTVKIVLLSAIPVKNPIKKLPITLTKSVPTGIEKKSIVRFNLETKYLATLPINPPIPISIIVLSIVRLSEFLSC